jgi:hypothetical protein
VWSADRDSADYRCALRLGLCLRSDFKILPPRASGHDYFILSHWEHYSDDDRVCSRARLRLCLKTRLCGSFLLCIAWRFYAKSAEDHSFVAAHICPFFLSNSSPQCAKDRRPLRASWRKRPASLALGRNDPVALCRSGQCEERV